MKTVNSFYSFFLVIILLDFLLTKNKANLKKHSLVPQRNTFLVANFAWIFRPIYLCKFPC